MATAPKAAKAPAEEAVQEAPKPKKSRKKLFVFLSILLLVGGLGGGAAWFLMGSDETPATAEGAAGGEGAQKPKAEKAKDMKPPVFMVLEPFTVNLQPESPGAPDQFLQIAFSLQVEDEKGVDSIKLYMPQVRSRLLLLLSGKKASQISTPDGKKKLADEIIDQLKQPFSPGMAPQPVTNVFFTSFVIQ